MREREIREREKNHRERSNLVDERERERGGMLELLS